MAEGSMIEVPETIGEKASSVAAKTDRPPITQIRVRNFKKIADTTVSLGPITYLVGGNNSGKSSVLQAVHTAVSCAQIAAELKQQVIAEASLRYSPSADFSLLGHGGPYENRQGGQRGIVDFDGLTTDGEPADYRIEMYKARNHHNVGVDRSGTAPGFGQIISDPKRLFSVYVPGLAGVPHREEMYGYAAVFRKAAGGEANLVFRNVIRLISDRALLDDLERLLGEVIGASAHFKVSYNPDRDLYVDVSLALGESPSPRDYIPVDLWGTGLLQITQIFAYVLLFRPALLLIDEPDSHIHPTNQRTLAAAFEKVVENFDCRIILSTHSRHLLTAASEEVKVVWMKDGVVQSDDSRELATVLMELGALDQLDGVTPDVIVCTEDSDSTALERALSEVSKLGKRIKVVRFNGLGNAMSAEAVREMSRLLVPEPRVIIHRDRDFITDDELRVWAEPYSARGIEVFCPPLCDLEAYHASPEHIATVAGISVAEANDLRDALLTEMAPNLRKKFLEKRRAAVQKLSPYGGAPRADDMWPVGATPVAEHVYGKDLLGRLNVELKKRDKSVGKLEHTASVQLIAELESVVTGSDLANEGEPA